MPLTTRHLRSSDNYTFCSFLLSFAFRVLVIEAAQVGSQEAAVEVESTPRAIIPAALPQGYAAYLLSVLLSL